MTHPTNPFLQAILAAAGDRRQVEAVLRQWGGSRIYVPRGPLRRAEPADLARRLVFGGVGRQAAQQMLQQRCLVSARHARRLVRAAVAIRGQTVSASAPKMEA